MNQATIKAAIEKKADYFLNLWNENHNTKIQSISHKFNLRGGVAGAFCHGGKEPYFRWNMEIAEKYFNDYLINVVGHEVAHLIAFTLDKNCAPHGTRWVVVMSALGLKIQRTHDYEFTPARKVPRPIIHSCPCGINHRLTIIKYKNMLKRGISNSGNTHYRCTECNRPLNIFKCKNQGLN